MTIEEKIIETEEDLKRWLEQEVKIPPFHKPTISVKIDFVLDLDVDISCLDLSDKLEAKLREVDIPQLRQLGGKTPNELLKYRGVGHSKVAEILHKARLVGLRLPGFVPCAVGRILINQFGWKNSDV